jgi:hypothetical protein
LVLLTDSSGNDALNSTSAKSARSLSRCVGSSVTAVPSTEKVSRPADARSVAPMSSTARASASSLSVGVPLVSIRAVSWARPSLPAGSDAEPARATNWHSKNGFVRCGSSSTSSPFSSV